MAQRSLPQAGDETLNPTYVDAGPYAGDEWAELFRRLFTTDQQATQGVFRNVDNELIPANPATRTVTIGTGMGIVNGHVLINDASVSIGVDAGAARDDSLVMLENNTNTAISAGAATNYNTEGNVDIPPYSARLAVVKDDAANFSQTNTLWMTRLATFTTGAGALTSFTDVRDYCEFASEVVAAMIPNRTRYVFMPATYGYNTTAGSDLSRSLGAFGGWDMPDGDTATIIGHFSVPADYASGLSVEAVVIPEGSGNLSCQMFADYGQCGEQYNIHSDATGSSVEAVVSTDWYCVQSLALANEAIADMVYIQFTRYGGAAADTVGADVNGIGFLVTYTADS
jgi:hypothetical protein